MKDIEFRGRHDRWLVRKTILHSKRVQFDYKWVSGNTFFISAWPTFCLWAGQFCNWLLGINIADLHDILIKTQPCLIIYPQNPTTSPHHPPISSQLQTSNLVPRRATGTPQEPHMATPSQLTKNMITNASFRSSDTIAICVDAEMNISWVEMAINSLFQNKEDGSRYCKSGNRRGWRANGGDKVHMYMISWTLWADWFPVLWGILKNYHRKPTFSQHIGLRG